MTDPVAADDIQARRPILLVLASTYPRWHGDPEPGFVHELAKRLVGRFRVVVVGPHALGALTQEVIEGVEVHRYRYAPVRWQTLVNNGGIVTNLRRSKWKLLLVPGFILAQACAAWRICRRMRVDVVHAHWLFPQGLLAVFLRMVAGRDLPFIVTSHGADLYALRGRVWDTVKRIVTRSATAVTAVSNVMREDLTRLGTQAEKIHVLPMGVDLADRFTPDDTTRNPGEILFVGRLVEKKGLRHLLDAMPAILARHPGAHLTIVGFGPEESELKAQAKQFSIDDKVTFIGAIEQSLLPALYRRAAVFVAPFVEAASGDREGLGLVTVEAIGCGCPVVVGDLPAVRDVLDPTHDASMLVTPGDAHALADAVSAVLADPEGTRDATLRLRRRTSSLFDWSSVASRYGKLLAGTGIRS